MSSIPPPRKLRIELGLDCPLRCRHCSANAAPGHPLALDTGMARRLIAEFAAMGGEEVTFTGGEPLVSKYLLDLLTDATTRGLTTAVFTSGIVFGEAGQIAVSREHLATLAPLLGRAVFSLYAIDAATHDGITSAPGSRLLTVTALRRAMSAGIRAELHFVPTRGNFRDLPALVREAARLGVQVIRVIRYVPHGRGRMHRDELALRPEEHADLREMLRTVTGDPAIAVQVGSGFGYLLDEAPPCTAAVEELVIAADGRIYPCSGFTGFHGVGAIRDITDSALADVWEQAPFLRAVRRLLDAREAPGTCCDRGCLAQKAIAGGILSDAIADPDAISSFAMEH